MMRETMSRALCNRIQLFLETPESEQPAPERPSPKPQRRWHRILLFESSTPYGDVLWYHQFGN